MAAYPVALFVLKVRLYDRIYERPKQPQPKLVVFVLRDALEDWHLLHHRVAAVSPAGIVVRLMTPLLKLGEAFLLMALVGVA